MLTNYKARGSFTNLFWQQRQAPVCINNVFTGKVHQHLNEREPVRALRVVSHRKHLETNTDGNALRVAWSQV
jgi:hypothetical protein